QQRSEILAALWAVVRCWRDQAGFDPGKQNRSFDEWGEIIGGIVECVCSNQSPLDPPSVSPDERFTIWQTFLTFVLRERSDLVDTPLEFGDLREVARESDLFPFMAEQANDQARDRKKEDS